jgi:hypothetical protein
LKGPGKCLNPLSKVINDEQELTFQKTTETNIRIHLLIHPDFCIFPYISATCPCPITLGNYVAPAMADAGELVALRTYSGLFIRISWNIMRIYMRILIG